MTITPEIATIATLLVTIFIAFMQVRAQAKQSALARQVERLNNSLDQSIQRLHRVRDLTNKIHRILQYSANRTSFMRQDPTDAAKASTEKISALNATLSISALELSAIVYVIGDAELSSALAQLQSVMNGASTKGDQNINVAVLVEQQTPFIAHMQIRVYQLLEIATL